MLWRFRSQFLRTLRSGGSRGQDARSLVECKTPRSVRDVPLPANVAAEPAEHLAAYPARDGFAFTAPKGQPWWHEQYGSRAFVAAVEAAGAPAGTTTHDLRHHYASVLLAAGESVVAVAERLGDENAHLVLTTYGHLLPDSEERTRRAIEQAWCAPSVPQGEADVL